MMLSITTYVEEDLGDNHVKFGEHKNHWHWTQYQSHLRGASHGKVLTTSHAQNLLNSTSEPPINGVGCRDTYPKNFVYKTLNTTTMDFFTTQHVISLEGCG